MPTRYSHIIEVEANAGARESYSFHNAKDWGVFLDIVSREFQDGNIANFRLCPIPHRCEDVEIAFRAYQSNREYEKLDAIEREPVENPMVTLPY